MKDKTYQKCIDLMEEQMMDQTLIHSANNDLASMEALYGEWVVDDVDPTDPDSEYEFTFLEDLTEV